MNLIPEQFPASATTTAKSGLLADLKRMPLIIQLVLLFMIVIFTWRYPILGFNLSGLAWVIPFAVSLLVLSRNMSLVTFPYILWFPWALLLFTYLAMVDSSLIDPRVIPAQRTLQLLSPLTVGMAVSTWRPTAGDLQAFLATCRRLAYLIVLIVLFKTGVLLTGKLPSITGLAAEAIAVTLLCTLFATSHIITRSKTDLILWSLLVCVPIIAITRTAIVASLLTFPLSFAPLPFIRRIVALALIVMVGVALFNTERVQKKMFFSGKGKIQDISRGNENFATTGRSYMYEKMAPVAYEEVFTGHGTGSGETFVYKIARLAYPHNDYLLTLFDYGALGIVVYFACILMAIGHAVMQLRQRPDDNTRILLIAGAAAFIPFVMLMFTDNIMVYASYFGDLHFIILGIAYGALRARQENAPAAKTFGTPYNWALR